MRQLARERLGHFTAFVLGAFTGVAAYVGAMVVCAVAPVLAIAAFISTIGIVAGAVVTGLANSLNDRFKWCRGRSSAARPAVSIADFAPNFSQVSGLHFGQRHINQRLEHMHCMLEPGAKVEITNSAPQRMHYELFYYNPDAAPASRPAANQPIVPVVVPAPVQPAVQSAAEPRCRSNP